MTSDKVTPKHLSRKAILYVRQSTAQQLAHNEESRRLQYAMQDNLHLLGWSSVEIIDDDLGRSAGGSVERSGFERMVAEVSLGHVGVVAARELSRFARNSREWQQLIEVCRIVDTLLVDHDAIYNPRQSNDRLLLGLKGSLSEYELELLRLRSHEARRSKAARGEFLMTPAIGYLKSIEGRLEKDPDRRVQKTIRLIFDKCLELGSVRQAMLWFRSNEIEIPVSRRSRQRVVVWRTVTYHQMLKVVTNPIYAGAYAFGKTEVTQHLEQGRLRRRVSLKPMSQWQVLIRDHHDAYVTWEEFERIQQMIKTNSQKRSRLPTGAPKKGSAILSGLIRCRRCGQKLMVQYGGQSNDVARYACYRARLEQGDTGCISFSALDVDVRVGQILLDVVQPGAIEAARRATEEQYKSQDDLLDAIRTELQAARYTADRAWKQYDGVDPENRLVADELERRWNVALERVREIEERLRVTEKDRDHRDPLSVDQFDKLASDLAHIWSSEESDVRIKKRIVRTLIEEIIADVNEEERQIVLLIHWKGGVHSELRVEKRRRGQNRKQTSIDVVNAVRDLVLICTDERIAAWLSRAGIPTARGAPWSRSLIASLRRQHDIPCFSPDPDDPWMALRDAEQLVGVSWQTLHLAIQRGELSAKHPLPNGPWIVRRSELTKTPVVRRLQKRRARRGQDVEPRPDELPFGKSRT